LNGNTDITSRQDIFIALLNIYIREKIWNINIDRIYYMIIWETKSPLRISTVQKPADKLLL